MKKAISERATIRLQAKVVGINNRDFVTFLLILKPNSWTRTPLEGRYHCDQWVRYSSTPTYSVAETICEWFLIGSALMEQADLDKAIRNLLVGEHIKSVV